MSTAQPHERERSRLPLRSVAQPPAPRTASGELRAAVLEGLAARRRRIPPKYFYDERGARLFDRITRLPEYYPTRTETHILETHAASFAAAVGAHVRLVEFGSGSGMKTKILLRALESPSAYVPIDISTEQLYAFADELRAEFPRLRVQPLAADYMRDFALPDPLPGTRRTVGFFPGSTIGNLERVEAVRFLRRLRALCGAGGALIVGADLHKDTDTLERAYNDAQGVTAQFNLNLLHRINRECGADFVPEAFEHRAVYDVHRRRIEMHLVCTLPCVVHVPLDATGAAVATFRFAPGDFILTEYSHKYTLESFAELATDGGWSVHEIRTDPDQRFSVWLLG